jgi:hypothetical protein
MRESVVCVCLFRWGWWRYVKVSFTFVRFQAHIGNEIVILECLLHLAESVQDEFSRSFGFA